MQAVVLTLHLDSEHVEATRLLQKVVGEVFTCGEREVLRLDLVFAEISFSDSHNVLGLNLVVYGCWVHIFQVNGGDAAHGDGCIFSDQPDFGFNLIKSLIVVASYGALHEG